MTAGDMTVQLVIEKKNLVLDGSRDSWDTTRTLRWSLAGLALHGPYFFYTFAKVDKYFGTVTSLSNVLRKTAFVQVTVFPGYLTMLFTFLGLVEGLRSSETLWSKVTQRVPEAFAGGCVFWPLVNTVNFRYVPPHMRVLYLASAGTVWNTFLSYINVHDEWKYYFGGADKAMQAEISRLSKHCEEQEKVISELRLRLAKHENVE